MPAGEVTPRITFDYSTAPLWRNAALSDAAWQAFALGVDWGLDAVTRDRFTSRSIGGVAGRAARLTLLDVPMAWYTFVWTHEYGHKTRLAEDGVPSRVVVQGTPWTSLTAFTQPTADGFSGTPAIYGAGIEGTNVLLRRLDRRLFQSGRAQHAELTAIFVATGMSFGYIQRDLSAKRVKRGLIFQTSDPGDPAGYAITLAERRYGNPTLDQLQRIANGIRTGSWLSLLDYGFVTVGVGLFRDYVVRGERETPVRWINVAGISIAPGLRYEMTPVGPERQVRSWIKIGRTVGAGYVRWTENDDGGYLFGAGAEYFSQPIGRCRLGGWLDLWDNPGESFGARVEVNAECSRAASDRWSITFAAGGKGAGYVLGFPVESGAYASVGAGIRF